MSGAFAARTPALRAALPPRLAPSSMILMRSSSNDLATATLSSRRSVVDDDQLELAEALVEHALDRAAEHVRPVVDGQDDGDFGAHTPLP